MPRDRTVRDECQNRRHDRGLTGIGPAQDDELYARSMAIAIRKTLPTSFQPSRSSSRRCCRELKIAQKYGARPVLASRTPARTARMSAITG